MTPEEAYQAVFWYAIGRLAKREYTVFELREKLMLYVEAHAYVSVDADCIETMLSRLQAERLLSDERYAEAYVRSYGERYGVLEIVRRLQEKGVSRALIERCREQLEATALSSAYRLWQKRFTALPADGKERQRQFAYLARRGFAFETIYHLFDMLSQSNSPEQDIDIL